MIFASRRGSGSAPLREASRNGSTGPSTTIAHRDNHRRGTATTPSTTTASRAIEGPLEYFQSDDSGEVTSDEVIRRIERLVEQLVCDLDDNVLPVLSNRRTSALTGATNSDENNNNNDDDDDGKLPARSPRNTPWNGGVAASSDEDEEDGASVDDEDAAAAAAAADPSAVVAPSVLLLQKRFTLQQCRSYASLLAVASFCHSLLLCRRTTTLREVYYHFVTHFRCQRECNTAIAQLAALLHVPRHDLGLQASPRGSFVGDLQLIDKLTGQVVLDGRSTATSTSSQGYPITPDWLLHPTQIPWDVRTVNARCILIVETEGVFHRLCEDQLMNRQSCVMITSRGFPDFATRAMVSHLHTRLNLPVCGLADCNPFGASVLHTFVHKTSATNRNAAFPTANGGGGGVSHVHWLGLRPSQVQELRNSLPPAVFQKPTSRDASRLDSLLAGPWVGHGRRRRLHSSKNPTKQRRWRETDDLRLHKVELEALNWLGLDALTTFVERALVEYFASDEEQEDEDGLDVGCDGSDAGSDGSDDEGSGSDPSDEGEGEDNQGPQLQPADVSSVGVRADRTTRATGSGSEVDDDDNTTTDVETGGHSSESDDGWLDVI